MKKYLIGILLLIVSIFIIPTSIDVIATTSDESQIIVNTLYPEGVLDYHNLTNVNQVTVNDNYIAYTLDNSSIDIFNINNRQSTYLNDFTNVFEMKFVSNSQLLVVDYDDSTSNGSIKVITLSDDNTPTTSTLSNINLNNLKLIDIYINESTIYIGLIRNDVNFELYTLECGTTLGTPTIFDTESIPFYNSATLLVVNNNYQYVVYDNIDNLSRILVTPHSANVNDSTPYNMLGDIQTLKYYKSGDNEYLLAFTDETLYLLDATSTNFESHITSLSKVDMNVKKFTDVDIYNSNIIICDTTSKFIKSYSFETSANISLSNEKLLLSSSDNSLGRFNNASNIFIQGSTYYISDTKNNRIQIIDNLVCYEIDDLDTDVNPHSVLLDSKQNIYLTIQNTNYPTSSILKYTQDNHNYSKVTTYSAVNDSNLGLVADCTIDTLDNIYIIDYTNNNLLYLNNAGLQLKSSLNGLTTSASTRIEYIRNSNLLAIYNDNIIYLYDLDNLAIVSSISISNCTDITVDFSNIIALCNDEIKYVVVNDDNTMQISDNSLVCNTFSQFNCITCDIVTNQIFAFNTYTQSINYLDNTLSDNPFEFKSITTTSPVTTTIQPFAINILNNGIIYDQPYYLGNYYLDIDNCIGIEEFNGYYRVLFNYNNTLRVGFLPKEFANIVNYSSSQKIRVIATNLEVPVYKYPTLLQFDTTPIIITHIPINTYLNVSYNAFPISIDGKQFYLYENNGEIGYIFNADIVLDDSKNITYLNTENASISAIGENNINVYSEDKSTVILTLSNEDRVYVENYDKNQEYTLVVYKDSDLNTIAGYVKTKYIQMDKLDNSKIILIVIIVLSVIMLGVIITSYIIIKRRK